MCRILCRDFTTVERMMYFSGEGCGADGRMQTGRKNSRWTLVSFVVLLIPRVDLSVNGEYSFIVFSCSKGNFFVEGEMIN